MKKDHTVWWLLGGLGVYFVVSRLNFGQTQTTASPSTSAVVPTSPQAAALGVSNDTLAAMPYLTPSSTSS